MNLYIDADALPNILKPILLRAIEKQKIETFVVSNKKVTIGNSAFIHYIIVSAGADEADNHIVELVQEDDLVITADIPLADRVISKMLMRLIIEENCIQKIILNNILQ